MYKVNYIIGLLDFGFYWRQFKRLFTKPFENRKIRKNKLKNYDRIWEENQMLKKINQELELQLWKKDVRLKEAHRLLKVSQND